MSENSVRVAILNDYEVVVTGLAQMLKPFHHRVQVVELDVNTAARRDIDVALYDTFAQPQTGGLDYQSTLRTSNAAQLVIYTWTIDPDLARQAISSGASGYLSKQLEAEALVAALERVHAGQRVVQLQPTAGAAPILQEHPPAHPRADPSTQRNWPGRAEGLSERESEVIAMIVQGLSNDEVAARAFVSVNTVKFHLRSAYRKMGVQSRSQAVLWGIDHGFRPPSLRIR